MNAGAISWLLAQTFWVGGLWLLKFLVVPALAKLGLAPLLIEEIAAALTSLLIGLTACCAVLQLFVLVRLERLASLWQDLRGQLLLTVLLVAGSYFVVRHWWPEAQRWLLFSYLVLAFCGLLLVLQPVPARRAQ
ncbi:DUF4149 domain-containing protein [Pseudomonas benzenivorans]|uniref:DUF4149 domain-containing protein n=1 Tax=Pseudomonas benzenivorans TaxID=556533 RepID=A0ABY5HBS4_9PSED|nr:DUF4149 domain-containing protein [Pseudomonas benzenivorans]UTW09292.1 DUF4149 domain-containing protein [Pseudomonas benzenivorans]